MSFPFETDNETISEKAVNVPREYEIDFDTGELTGKIVDGLEAIKIWIYNSLRTTRYRFDIFSWDYGNEIEDLIGNSYTQEYIEIEVKRMIEECLSINEYITGIDNFSVSFDTDKLSVFLTVNTLFGEVDINV